MKQLLVITCLLSPFLLRAQNATYTLNGKLAGVKAPAKAYLVTMTTGAPKWDSVQVQNGTFSFKGAAGEPLQARLYVDKHGTGFNRNRPTPSISLYLEPGTIVVSSPDSLANAVVSGTPLNNDNQKLTTALRATTDQMALLMKEYQAATPEQKKSKEFEQNLDKRYEAIQQEQKKAKAQFIRDNPGSLVSLHTLQRYDFTPKYDEVNPLFEGLSGALKNSTGGREYAAMLVRVKATDIGAVAPEFTQADTSGKAVSLNSFRGKYVLVDFWASWCGPCRAENPNVVKSYQQYKDKNFTVLGVSLDRPNAKDAWLTAIHKDNLTWTHVSDLKFWDNDVAKQYGIRSIPQNFLLDPSGKIVAKNIRGEALSKKLEEILVAKP